MASFNTELKHKTICLVHGFIKDCEKKLKLSAIIPTEIYHIFVVFMLFADEWDKSLMNPEAFEIDRKTNIIKKIKIEMQTVYGTHVVAKGACMEWKLDMINMTSPDTYDPRIGLIKNDPKLLETQKTSCTWWQKEEGFVIGCGDNYCGYGSGKTGYLSDRDNKFKETGSTFVMKLDMTDTDQKYAKVSFIINGVQVPASLEIQLSMENEWRFAMALNDCVNTEIKMCDMI